MSQPPRAQGGDLRTIMAELGKVTEALSAVTNQLAKESAKSDARHSENLRRFANIEESHDALERSVERVQNTVRENLSTTTSGYREIQSGVRRAEEAAARAQQLAESLQEQLSEKRSEDIEAATRGAASGSSEKDKRIENIMYMSALGVAVGILANLQKIYEWVMSVWGTIDKGTGG